MLLFSFPQHLKNRRIRVDIAGQQQQQGEEFIVISSVAQYNVMKLSLYPQLSFPLTFEFVNEILCCDHSNESYWTEYFPVVLLIMLYKVVLTFKSVDEILKCDHSMTATEQYFHVVLFIMLYKVVLTF